MVVIKQCAVKHEFYKIQLECATKLLKLHLKDLDIQTENSKYKTVITLLHYIYHQVRKKTTRDQKEILCQDIEILLNLVVNAK